MGFDLIAFLGEKAREVCKKRDFVPIDPSPAERHGSWEWSFHKKSAGLDRFVSVALSNLPTGGLPDTWYNVEISAGADNGERFAKHIVLSDFRAIERQDYSASVEAMLQERLPRAIEIAERLKSGDLTEVYLSPRSSR